MNAATLTFDRLAYIDRLKVGGIDEEQARAHAAALDTALRDGVATRSDLEGLGFTLRSEMADLGKELRTEMADLGKELRTEMADLGKELRAEMADLGKELRAEMADLGKELRAELVDLRKELVRLEAKIDTTAAALKVDILRWLIVTQIALGGFMFAILKFAH